jgi:hypothetical protein
MTRRLVPVWLPVAVFTIVCCDAPRLVQALDSAVLQKVIDAADGHRTVLLKSLLASPPSAKRNVMWDYTNFALAAYWLQERIPEADRAMITASCRDAVRWRGNDDAPTSKHSYYKQLYLLERVYFLFNGRSEYFPGRMSPAAEKAVTDMLWQWASTACRKDALAPDRDWRQWGTENIGALMWSSLWGATQILAEHPDYRDKQYADGTPVAEMANAFNDYYKRFTRERAGKGLLVECASGYNKWTLNAWYNIADFARDPLTRQRMRMFLDLYWADWAIEQIDAVRGGSRHRCYPGPGSTEGSDGGNGPSWYLFGVGRAEGKNPALVGVGTTFYRPSPVVVDLVLDLQGRGTYAYCSRRPGLGKSLNQEAGGIGFAQDEEFLGEAGGHILNPEGGNLLRYTWCTPNFVMGTSMVPALRLDDWARISSQNRWEGAIFGGHATARIFVQPVTKKSFYNGNWSVQNKGVLIVQRLKTSEKCSGQRVWFDKSLPRQESGGWVFAEAPRAYAAVRVVEGKTDWQPDTPLSKKEKPGPGLWLNCQQEFTPVILEVAEKSDYTNFAAFQKAILANPLHWENKKLDYRSGLYQTQLTLFADYSQVPQIDGVPVNYNPSQAYQSPFIQGDFGSGVVTVRKDQRELVLDFTKDH